MSGADSSLIVIPQLLIRPQKQGYIREKVIAAAIAHFLRSGPTERAAMFEDLDKLVKGKAN